MPPCQLALIVLSKTARGRGSQIGGPLLYDIGVNMAQTSMKLSKYSVGTGDRFAHQARPQLQACIQALGSGIEVVPVWNKSNREHTIIGSEPLSVRQSADASVKELGWKLPYFCDADHITSQTVSRFLNACDFYTIDVADYIGLAISAGNIDEFVKRRSGLLGRIQLESTSESFEITSDILRRTAQKYLAAVKKAGGVYRVIVKAKGKGNFIPEVSMDETDTAQSPVELLIILAAMSDEGIPVQTIAPKFSGRFNKGVDYVGNVAQFEREFALDVAALAYATAHFGLPENLKINVHSGSDKFSIYPAIHATMKRFDAGVAPQNGRNNMAERADWSGRVQRRRAEVGQRNLCRSFCSPRGALRALCIGHRPQHHDVPVARRSRKLDLGTVHICAATCAFSSRLQQQSASITSRWLQGCSQNGRPLPRPPRSQ
jgi:hypothetical protein